MPELTCDAAVVGGGPAGASAAELLAQAGFSVAVFEEHATPGEPVQCAGLISPRCLDIAGLAGSCVIGRLNGARIVSPSGRVLEIGGNADRAVVIDRAAFDRLLSERAQDAGAVIFTGSRVRKIERGRGSVRITAAEEMRAKLVIGADGAKSSVRDFLGLQQPTFMLRGIAADVTGACLPQDRAAVFFGRHFAPNFFAWIIPSGDVARVGLCVRGSDRSPAEHLKMFFRHGPAAEILKGAKVARYRSGLIPLGMMPKTYAEAGMVVGDAACQVKATSGGGIFPGLVCARHCADTAAHALETGDMSPKTMAGYHNGWMGEIGGELEKAMAMHRVLSSMDDRQLEDVLRMLANPELTDIVNRVGDIDYPSRLAWNLIREEPGFLKYAGKFLRHGILEL